MKFVVIGLSGKAQVGKSTSSKMIEDFLSYSSKLRSAVKKISFARKLKEIAVDVFGWDGNKDFHYAPGGFLYEGPGASGNASFHLSIDTRELIQDQGRQLLINIGKKMREINPDVWVNCAAKDIADDLKVGGDEELKVYLIDDIRFTNEMEALKRSFGENFISVRLTRNNGIDINDVTEKDLDEYKDFDFFIENNGTEEQLLTGLKDTVLRIIGAN
jgi:hypothetical protein